MFYGYIAKWLVIFFLVLLDQLTKRLALGFHLHSLSFNQGISFGWWPSETWLLFNGLILGLLGWLVSKKYGWPLVLIFAGGLSNFFDRMMQGSIVDWIKIPVLPWSFNVADASITLGAIILLHCYIASLLKNNETIEQ